MGMERIIEILINPYKYLFMAKTKQANKDCPDLSRFPNFHKSGSITGMKKMFYGKDALLVKKGEFIYNVTSSPSIYHDHAH